MKHVYWIKWNNQLKPERWECDNLDEFWHRLREHFLRNPDILEWMIRD